MFEQFQIFTLSNAFQVYLYILFFTSHICLFVDLSKFQKHPMRKLTYSLACISSAIVPTLVFYTTNFSSLIRKYTVLTVIAILFSILFSLTFQIMFKSETKELI